MRKYMSRLWRDLRFPMIMAFGTLPLPLVLMAYYAPALLGLVWVWPLVYVLLDALSTKVRRKWRVAYCALELAAVAAMALFTARYAADDLVMFVPVMYAVLLLWGLVLSAEDRNERINALWYAASIIIHILGQLFLYSSKVLENPALLPIEPWLLISFFLFAALSLITLNQANLAYATNGRQSASQIMQRKNLLMVLAFFAIAVLISFVPAIANAISECFRWILSAVLWLIAQLSEEKQQTGQAPAGEMGEGSIFNTGAEHTMPQWLNILLTVIALILVAAALLCAVYFAVKKLMAFAKYLMRITGKYLHAVSEDYVDEITDTRDDQDENERREKRRRTSVLEERRLPPDQRIRYRYLRLMQKHPEWDSGSTARENLPESAAPLYERVRYSPYPVTEEDAQQFSAETKKV